MHFRYCVVAISKACFKIWSISRFLWQYFIAQKMPSNVGYGFVGEVSVAPLLWNFDTPLCTVTCCNQTVWYQAVWNTHDMMMRVSQTTWATCQSYANNIRKSCLLRILPATTTLIKPQYYTVCQSHVRLMYVCFHANLMYVWSSYLYSKWYHHKYQTCH